MPLFLKGKKVDLHDQNVSIFLNASFKQERGSDLTEQSVQKISEEKLLYVNQREYAGTLPDDDVVDILGTDDATTCHIIILRHTGSGAVCLGHCDGCDTKNGVDNMINLVHKLSHGKPDGRIDLHLIGGFLDDREESRKLSKEILELFINHEETIHLVTALITDLNDTMKNESHFPIIYGVAVDVKSGKLLRATFPDKGPVLDVRSACHFAGFKDMMNIYDYSNKQLRIGPYKWEPWQKVEQWLHVPNAFLRRYLSTSPEQEPEHFEDQVRASLRILYEHPKPHQTLFPDGKPWTFTKQGQNEWQKI